MNLPEALVEKIIAMMPFPSIFKCRCLSKSWLARLSSIQSQDDDEAKKRLAILFQNRVGEYSNRWTTFSAVLQHKEVGFIGYDRVCHKMRRLPSLSFLPDAILSGMSPMTLDFDGALLYAFHHNGIRTERYVANVLTRVWKQLPACPKASSEPVLGKLVSYPCSETYKVISLCKGRKGCSVQIYDSKSDAWGIKEVTDLHDFPFHSKRCNFVYLNGVIYFWRKDLYTLKIGAFNVGEGTLAELDVPSNRFLDEGELPLPYFDVTLMLWNADLLIVLNPFITKPQTFYVLKIDVQSAQLLQCARGPPPSLEVALIHPGPVFDGHCIVFGVERKGIRILTYDVDKDEWSFFPLPPSPSSLPPKHRLYKWLDSVFQPGLSSFAAV